MTYNLKSKEASIHISRSPPPFDEFGVDVSVLLADGHFRDDNFPSVTIDAKIFMS
jgi:hypothetical protein